MTEEQEQTNEPVPGPSSSSSSSSSSGASTRKMNSFDPDPTVPNTTTAPKSTLTCVVCKKFGWKFKILPCLHHVCPGICMEKIFEHEDDTIIDPEKAECPVCKVIFDSDEIVESKLSTPYGGSSGDMGCTICEVDASVAIAFCPKCEVDGEFMCRSCHDHHQIHKHTKIHEVRSVEEGIQYRSSLLKKEVDSLSKCKIHYGTENTQYCLTCEKMICVNCGPEHGTHEVNSIDEVARETRLTLANFKKDYEHKWDQKYRETSQRIKDKIEIIEKHEKPSLGQEIYEQVERAARALNKRYKEICTELAISIKRKISESNVKIYLLDSYNEQIHHYSNYVENLTQCSVPELLMNRKLLIKQGNALKTEPFSLIKPENYDKFTGNGWFYYVSTKGLKKIEEDMQEFGKLYYTNGKDFEDLNEVELFPKSRPQASPPSGVPPQTNSSPTSSTPSPAPSSESPGETSEGFESPPNLKFKSQGAATSSTPRVRKNDSIQKRKVPAQESKGFTANKANDKFNDSGTTTNNLELDITGSTSTDPGDFGGSSILSLSMETNESVENMEVEDVDFISPAENKPHLPLVREEDPEPKPKRTKILVLSDTEKSPTPESLIIARPDNSSEATAPDKSHLPVLSSTMPVLVPEVVTPTRSIPLTVDPALKLDEDGSGTETGDEESILKSRRGRRSSNSKTRKRVFTPKLAKSKSKIRKTDTLEPDSSSPVVGKDQMKITDDDPSEDYCGICLDGGDDLICCDKCPKVFHIRCHVPNLQQVPGPNDEWQCMFCFDKDELKKRKVLEEASVSYLIPNYVTTESAKKKYLFLCKFVSEIYQNEETTFVTSRWPEEYRKKHNKYPVFTMDSIRLNLTNIDDGSGYPQEQDIILDYRRLFHEVKNFIRANNKLNFLTCFDKFEEKFNTTLKLYYPTLTGIAYNPRTNKSSANASRRRISEPPMLQSNEKK